MKALPFKIAALENASLKVEREQLPRFYPYFHTHQELQLTHIILGRGTAFVGDAIAPFKPGDVFFIPSNLPHVFKSEEATPVESLSVYFDKSLITTNAHLPEYRNLNHFLEGLNQAAFFTNKLLTLSIQYLHAMETLDGIFIVTKLIELLAYILVSEDIKFLSTPRGKHLKTTENERISKIIDYLYEHSTNPITLTQVAQQANMTPQAFCRYFKKHTRKTMVEYLNQLRVHQVCQWLQQGNYTITECCYKAGFNNISNFNRQFKAITGFTPRTFIAQQKSIRV